MTFDLGGVLVDWNPRYLYRQLLDSDEEVERFLREVCTQSWNHRQDAGRSIAEAVAELAPRFPDQLELIEAYYARFGDMLGDVISDNVALVEELSERGVPLYALSNWSAETFPIFAERADAGFLDRFEALVISGREGVIKPDRAIYDLLVSRHGLVAAETLFIDDVEANVAGARAAGLEAIRYVPGVDLRAAVLAWLSLEP